MIVYAGSAFRYFPNPLGIVTAVLNDRLAEQLPKTHVILSGAVGGVEESTHYPSA